MLATVQWLMVFMLLLSASCITADIEKISSSPLDMPALIPAPDDPAQWDAWRDRLITWRSEAKTALDYNDFHYNQPEFAWTSKVFSCYYVMLWDERFLDSHTHTYRTDMFLKEVETQFGPIDGLVIWHGYPNLGFDRKTQFDMYRNMPGGLEALRQLADNLHARNIRLFVCFNPWDIADGISPDDNIERMIRFTCALDADGVFLDTWTHGPKNLLVKFNACRPGIVLESELDLPLQAIANHHFSWAQWIDDSPVPGVFRDKWLEPRHMMHLIRRWDTDHSSELQSAWMNGAGIFVWENVFGSYNPWSERDKYLLRSVRALQTYFADWFSSGEWTPLVPTAQKYIYASQWTMSQGTLWTVVNRTEDFTVKGTLLNVNIRPNCRWFNLINGVEMTPPESSDKMSLNATLPPRALGGFISLNKDAVTEDFLELLRHQHAINIGQPGLRRDIPTIQRVSPLDDNGLDTIPSNMRLCLGGLTTLNIHYRLRENGFYYYAPLADTRFPALHTPCILEKQVYLKSF
ncbi:MAG: hypothetical protein JW709_00180, partial [Sedimentisphaerales bacterium]|nr:hypothetical protein [Sedimentisphaerales bacterium]